MRLFAPAQKGFRQGPALTSAMATNPVSGLTFALFLLWNRAFNDLQPDSGPLDELERDHTSMASHPARCAKVVWAKDDYVVVDTLLACDDGRRESGKNHRTICKARDNYLLPLEIVLK
jgi:hypothetical protein